VGSGYIWACSTTYIESSGLASFVPYPPFNFIVFLCELYVGNDKIDKCFIEKLGVSRNCNLDNPTSLKEKTAREEIEIIGIWLIWGFTCSIKKGMKLSRWIVLSTCCSSVLGT